MTLHEFESIRAFLRTLPPSEVERVLEQPKRVKVADGWEVEACRFRDVGRGRCLIYPARPLICRLFGVVDFLPCPIGRVKRRVEDVDPILAWYSEFERRTFDGWVSLLGREGPLCLGQPARGEAPSRGCGI